MKILEDRGNPWALGLFSVGLLALCGTVMMYSVARSEVQYLIARHNLESQCAQSASSLSVWAISTMKPCHNPIASCVTLIFFLLHTSVAIRPNPCANPRARKFRCRKPRVSAAQRIKWNWRRAICVFPPYPHRGCACPEDAKTVQDVSRYRTLAVLTMNKSSRCDCECIRGTALFEGNCSSPPPQVKESMPR